MVSCVILTKNEAQDIEKCLESLRWCDDIHVLDSGSTDETTQIAKRLGAHTATRLTQGTFRHADQRNWALKNLSFRHEWVLFIDADEIASPEFVNDVLMTLESSTINNSYYCAPKFMYHGRWLRRTKSFPTWEPRIIHVGSTAFESGGWERFDDRAVSGYVHTPYEHYPNSKGISSWVAKHINYAVWESENGAGQSTSPARRFASKFGPLRPFLVLVWFFIIRLGFLEGREGLSYVRRMFIYELIVREAILERKAKLNGRSL